jgi:hypothetical protein
MLGKTSDELLVAGNEQLKIPCKNWVDFLFLVLRSIFGGMGRDGRTKPSDGA